MLKRFIDLTASTTALIVLTPMMLTTAIIVEKKIGKPIIFTQERIGKDNRKFKIYKFRTMTTETDEQGRLLPNELRHTKIGSLLRKYSLDELPQLYNVLKGDLSLVGPRPLLVEYLPLYDNFQIRRHEVKPGITGWAQVNGRNSLSWEEKFELDVWYVDNRNMWLDLYILYLTIIKVVKSEGVNNSRYSTMNKFKGSK